jgi:hypothetical protein
MVRLPVARATRPQVGRATRDSARCPSGENHPERDQRERGLLPPGKKNARNSVLAHSRTFPAPVDFTIANRLQIFTQHDVQRRSSGYSTESLIELTLRK